ncbi:hypothetical protein [Flexivirga oryzae]|uniref:Uncharacterized protein n=1 Tax=Flexivirga oryzae TaxID=1794944 RepID=A0A839N6F8_9MICO|nr:hypothetical protein [Flexivirga oryzae]MBB2893330.1 hypothetical protein [Flexivirga oryzae]
MMIRTLRVIAKGALSITLAGAAFHGVVGAAHDNTSMALSHPSVVSAAPVGWPDDGDVVRPANATGDSLVGWPDDDAWGE